MEGEGKEKKKRKKRKKERDKRLAGELECTMFEDVRTPDSKNSSAASRSLTGRGVRLGLL